MNKNPILLRRVRVNYTKTWSLSYQTPARSHYIFRISMLTLPNKVIDLVGGFNVHKAEYEEWVCTNHIHIHRDRIERIK